MGRRIYIIPKSMKVEDAVEDARAKNCPEIAHGIPPRLEELIDESSLPMVYEEPTPPPVSERDLLAEIDALYKVVESLATSVNTLANETDSLKTKVVDYDELKVRIVELEKR